MNNVWDTQTLSNLNAKETATYYKRKAEELEVRVHELEKEKGLLETRVSLLMIMRDNQKK